MLCRKKKKKKKGEGLNKKKGEKEKQTQANWLTPTLTSRKNSENPPTIPPTSRPPQGQSAATRAYSPTHKPQFTSNLRPGRAAASCPQHVPVSREVVFVLGS